jgi:hypothetical protein
LADDGYLDCLGAWCVDRRYVLAPLPVCLVPTKSKTGAGSMAGSRGIWPTVLAIAWCSAFLLTLTDGDQDLAPDERGLGILLLPAMLILLTTLLFYYGKLAVQFVKRVSASSENGS